MLMYSQGSSIVFQAAQEGLKAVSTQHHSVSKLYRLLKMTGSLEKVW